MLLISKFFRKFAKKEKVIIYTEDFEIQGWLYNSGLSSNRFLSNLLNGANKNFIAITDCEIIYLKKGGEMEHQDFLQLNMRYVILIKPAPDLVQDSF